MGVVVGFPGVVLGTGVPVGGAGVVVGGTGVVDGEGGGVAGWRGDWSRRRAGHRSVGRHRSLRRRRYWGICRGHWSRCWRRRGRSSGRWRCRSRGRCGRLRQDHEGVESGTRWCRRAEGHRRGRGAGHRNTDRSARVDARADGTSEEVLRVADFVACARGENAAEVDGDRRLEPPVVDNDIAASWFVRIWADRNHGACWGSRYVGISRKGRGRRQGAGRRELGAKECVVRDRRVRRAVGPAGCANEVVVGDDRANTTLHIPELLAGGSFEMRNR